jgi:hypothetical protein
VKFHKQLDDTGQADAALPLYKKVIPVAQAVSVLKFSQVTSGCCWAGHPDVQAFTE